MMADVPADPNRGAAGTEVQTLQALRGLGHEVDAIWSGDLGQRIRHGNLHLLLELPKTYEAAVLEAVRRKPYDVFHVNQPHGFRAARAVHRHSPHSVFVHRSHGFELNVEASLRPWRRRFDDDKRRPLRRVLSRGMSTLLARHGRAIAREADGHIVSSSPDARFLHERLGVPEERIAVIAQAAPDSYLRHAAPPMTPQRLRNILHVAQFAFFKAPMVTTAAINSLAAQRTDFRFTWVCDGNDHVRIRSMLSAPANEKTTLLPWMGQEELRAVYDDHGVFLFPSFFEGFGKAFLEAMSRGLCVVASDAGGMHDLIEQGRNGILVPPGQATVLAEAARAIVTDPSTAATMSVAAARTAREYTWERVATETAAFYGRLLAVRG